MVHIQIKSDTTLMWTHACINHQNKIICSTTATVTPTHYCIIISVTQNVHTKYTRYTTIVNDPSYSSTVHIPDKIYKHINHSYINKSKYTSFIQFFPIVSHRQIHNLAISYNCSYPGQIQLPQWHSFIQLFTSQTSPHKCHIG